MKGAARLVVSVSLLWAGLACSGDPGEERAPASGIREAEVYRNERYWPAIVALAQAWQPPGESRPLQAQWRGVLVRVEPEGTARIDFGRHGRHEVPIGYTDLVQRANEIREGVRTKLAPNFVLRVGNNLVDASSRPIRAHRLVEIVDASGFLCLFADPRAEAFADLVRELAALEGSHDVRTLFFPQAVGAEDLAYVHERLGSLAWQVPFLYPRLSASYTVSLLGEPPAAPRALLLSPEGRVLYEREVGPGSDLSELRQAIDGVERRAPRTERSAARLPAEDTAS